MNALQSTIIDEVEVFYIDQDENVSIHIILYELTKIYVKPEYCEQNHIIGLSIPIFYYHY